MALAISLFYGCNRDALRYSFGPLIQQELMQFASEWNNHRIRQSHMAEVPAWWHP